MLSPRMRRFTPNMTPREVIDGLNQIVEALGRFSGLRPPAAPLGQTLDGVLFLDDTQYKRVPARLSTVNTVDGQLRYGFVQQIFDPDSGVYSDWAPAGLIGDGTLTYATETNNQSVGIDTIVWLRSKGIVAGLKVYEFNSSTRLAYVQPTTTTPSQIILGRTITDAILDGTVVLFSPQDGNFTQKDVGGFLVGDGIPDGTVIDSVDSGTTVTMSNAATTEAENVTVAIETGSVKGYAAVAVSQDSATGAWKRRTITDAGLSGTTLTSSLQAVFTLGDVGAMVSGSGIPANTTIVSITDSTTVTLSASATTGADVTVTIQQGDLPIVWLEQANDSVWENTIPQPVTIPVFLTTNYPCRSYESDVDGVPVWVTGEKAAAASLESTTAAAVLTTTFANFGLEVSLPPNSTWLLTAQLTASITSSATGAGDSISFRYSDGTNVYGVAVECCYAVCDTITFVDSAPLVAIITTGNGNSAVLINVEGQLNTTSSSSGSVVSSYLAAVRLAVPYR